MNTLPATIHDDHNGLTYTMASDVDLPDFEIETGEAFGKYGSPIFGRTPIRLVYPFDFEREADRRPVRNRQAQRLLDQMIPQMAKRAGINEAMKESENGLAG